MASAARTSRARPLADDGLSPSVILMEPAAPRQHRHGGARLANFGLDDLRLVAPRDGWPNEKARIAASGANYIIDDAAAYPNLDAAIGDLNWLCATTARQRDLGKPVLTPEQADRRDAPADRTRASAAACCSGASATGWRPWRSPMPTRSS